jgi:hypothetical protein
VNPTARFWEAGTNVPTEKADQPKDYKNYDDRPQHKISPFECSIESQLNGSNVFLMICV